MPGSQTEAEMIYFYATHHRIKSSALLWDACISRRRYIMPDFAMFETVDGETVAVHIDQVTYVRPRIDGIGTLIAFAGDDGIGVQGTLHDVVQALTTRSAKDQATPDRAR